MATPRCQKLRIRTTCRYIKWKPQDQFKISIRYTLELELLFSQDSLFKVWMPQMVQTATITAERKIIVSDFGAHRLLCSFRSLKVLRYHNYLGYKCNETNQFIGRINSLNFMMQFPLPVYLNQIYSAAIYVVLPLKLKKLHLGKHLQNVYPNVSISSLVIRVNLLHP